MEKDNKFMVVTLCFTYNQESYILDTLDGFTMQETAFPFLSIILDDASTDGTDQKTHRYLIDNFEVKDTVETEYARIEVAEHKINKNCFFVVYYYKENLYQQGKQWQKEEHIKEWLQSSRYVAFCEGDDFWTDSKKLQKQVDCLNKNDAIVLCYTGFEAVDEKGEPTKNRYRPLLCHSGRVYDELLKTNFVQTATVLCKRICYEKANELMKERGSKYDYGLFLELSLMGDFQYILDKTVKYRICSESASHSKSLLKELKFALEIYNIVSIYWNLKNEPKSILRHLYSKMRLISIVTIKHYLRNIVHFKN